jgi:hypothetical protein
MNDYERLTLTEFAARTRELYQAAKAARIAENKAKAALKEAKHTREEAEAEFSRHMASDERQLLLFGKEVM